jgi:hypothetical protein
VFKAKVACPASTGCDFYIDSIIQFTFVQNPTGVTSASSKWAHRFLQACILFVKWRMFHSHIHISQFGMGSCNHKISSNLMANYLEVELALVDWENSSCFFKTCFLNSSWFSHNAAAKAFSGLSLFGSPRRDWMETKMDETF